VDVHRLGNEVEGAGLQRFHRGLDVAVGGDHGHGGFGEAGGDVADQLQAGAVGQAHVGQAEVVLAAGQQFLRGGKGGGGIGAQAHAAQGQDKEFTDVVLVVDDEGAAGVCHGNSCVPVRGDQFWHFSP